MSLGCLPMSPESCLHHFLLTLNYVCMYLSFIQSMGQIGMRNSWFSQSLTQIPVVPQRTSGAIISWCLILHLFFLSLPVVCMSYGVLSLKAIDLFEMILAIA